jgi:DNA-binding transcriptional LysR family regulator
MQSIDDLVGMATFAAVVQAHSFTGAAEALGVSKSVASRRVSALERRLGVRLLHRTTRALELTEIGLAVYERCARLLTEAEEAELAATAHAGDVRGTVRVNAPGVLSELLLAPVLPQLLARHPQLRVDLSAADAYLEVVGGGFDVTLRVAGQPPDASTVARRLTGIALWIVASPAYLAVHGPPHHPRDLVGLETLRYAHHAARVEWRLERGDEVEVVPASGRFTANSGGMLRAAAEAGVGVAVLPHLEVSAAIASGRLVRVLPEWTAGHRALWAMYPHRRLVAPKVTAFVDFLAERLRG